MKFKLIHQAIGGGRLGIISDFERLPELTIETPTCLLYTRHGQVPCLTQDIVDQLERAPKLVNCPLNSIITKTNLLETNKTGLANLIKMENRAILLTQSDPTEPYQENGSNKTSVSVWTSSGRMRVTPTDLARCVRTARPEAVQLLSDSETWEASGTKKCRKSIDRTRDYLNSWIDVDAQTATRTPVLLSVAGGYSLKERQSCIETLAGHAAAGYVLEGFRGPNDTPLSMTLSDSSDSSSQTQSVIAECCRLLPGHSPRLLSGFGQPADLARGVQLGIDLFDGAFPYMLSQRRVAWLHRPITAGEEGREVAADDWLRVGERGLLTDLAPLQGDCECFTCRRHTRAYLCHLVITKELLANILLMIHNSHQYYLFFEELRNALRNDKLSDFVRQTSSIRCSDEQTKVVEDTLTCDKERDTIS